ncbi:D-alanyl-D-alanine carboxypeptidase [Microbacterium sp. SYP-A9085]|uniref:D-alanyl-D-alanine carboxypeptidase family protein n=1 Tax=Microbacterium sp. SYP-A9085 TaxID=2664454 RepID=UPI00129A7C3B|nr:D-alanyl-D-alanine carboxypeptidase [Microbacterium sp. SYP-A9085]
MTSADVTEPDAASGATSTATPAQALVWWDGSPLTAVHARTSSTATAGVSPDATTTLVPTTVPLLGDRRRRRGLRPGALIPLLLVVLLAVAYTGTMALWPLTAVPPTVSAATVTAHAAPTASLTWPAAGAAGVAVAGFGDPVASTTEQSSMASITKIVTALLVLDRSPVTADDQGPAFRFSYRDGIDYWTYLRRNESALNVPVGGTLTQYQLLEGMLIGSASNYAARLAGNWWHSNASFADAARTWLDERGIEGVTIVDPTGFDAGNTATPRALMTLAQLAMDNPTIAGIVGTASVTLPGAGTVKNTNTLLADPGTVGMKTGVLDGFNVLAVKNLTIGGVTVQVDAVTLNQPDSKTRWASARDLFAQVEKQLQPTAAVTADTVVGSANTVWGETVPVVAASDARLVLWNGSRASATVTLRPTQTWTKAAPVGTVTATGPAGSATVDAVLSRDVAGPGLWWRVTHPLELLGWD